MFAIGYPLILLLFLGGAVASFSQDDMEYQVNDSKLLKLKELYASKVRNATPFFKIRPERLPGWFSWGKQPMPQLNAPIFKAWIPGATDHVITKYPIHLHEADPRIAYSMLLNPAEGNYVIQERKSVPQGSYGPMLWKDGRWYVDPDLPWKNSFEMAPPWFHPREMPEVREKPKRQGEK